MQYTEEQIEHYINDYMLSNKEHIKSRLRFLLANWKEQEHILNSDIWFCFEEARHAFMMGDYIASIIMSAVTIERYLASLLEMPYYAPRDEKASLEFVGEKII